MNRKPREESEEIEEEADYVNEPVCTVEKVAAPPDQRFHFSTQSFPLISVCWLILLVIMGLRIHFTSVISENNTKLTAEDQQLSSRNQELETRNQQLSSRNQQLETRNQELETRNQQQETQKNNLTEQIRDMQTNWNELNVSRAQWSIEAYCPLRDNVRTCEPCQKGWLLNKSSCYAINNPARPDRKTWEEAREHCRGKNADFAVIHNQTEKDPISRYSWGSSGTDGYWIGLRVEDGKWKWIDGSDLTESSWIATPTDGHCAISVTSVGWKSVRCDDKQQWICRKRALTV